MDMAMELTAPLHVGEVNRSRNDKITIGGKGNNVAIVLNNLGEDVVPIAILAGFTGQKIEEYFKENFKAYRCLYVNNGFTRFAVNMKNEKETVVNGNGPIITKQDIDDLIGLLKECEDGSTLCISGSVPASLDEFTYSYIMEALKDKDIQIAIDSSKKLLLNTLQYRPLVIKPSLAELGEYFNVELDSKEDALPYMKKLQEAGARNVICSLGKDGAQLLSEDGNVYYMNAPVGKLVNSLGAGDSMMAGFLYEYTRSKDYEKALKMGIACGSASAFSSELATREEVEALLETL